MSTWRRHKLRSALIDVAAQRMRICATVSDSAGRLAGHAPTISEAHPCGRGQNLSWKRERQRMQPKVYNQLCGLNQSYEQVRRSLKRGPILPCSAARSRRFEMLAADFLR